jgi:hypothetical protein
MYFPLKKFRKLTNVDFKKVQRILARDCTSDFEQA